jgi:hypothetical protein
MKKRTVRARGGGKMKTMKCPFGTEYFCVFEDIEGQVGRIQEIIDKYNIKVSNFSLRKDLEKKEMAANFKLRLRTVQSDRGILKEVFHLEGIKRVDLKSS